MKHIIRFVTALFLATLITGSIQAQEAAFVTLTPVVTQTAPDVASNAVVAPVVVAETPDATDVDTLGFWQIAIHLINAGVALAIVFFLYRSVPAETRKELDTKIQKELKEAETRAKATETPLDDLIVEATKRGYKLVKAEAEKTEEQKVA